MIESKQIVSLLQGWDWGSSWLRGNVDEKITEDYEEEVVSQMEIPEKEFELIKDSLFKMDINIEVFQQGWLLAVLSDWYTWFGEKKEYTTHFWFKDLETNELLCTKEAKEKYITNENLEIFNNWQRKIVQD